MTKPKLIQPVKYLKNNQCPRCEGKLILVEQSLSLCDVDEIGLPYNIPLSEEFEVSLACSNCNEIYEAEKKGAYFYIKPKLPKIIYDKDLFEYYNPFLLKD